MICFRDRMFCSAICDTTWCDRNFSEEQERRAKAWWGDLPGPCPVQFKDLHKTCVEYRRVGHLKPPEGVDSRPTHGIVFADADPKFGGDEKQEMGHDPSELQD